MAANQQTGRPTMKCQKLTTTAAATLLALSLMTTALADGAQPTSTPAPLPGGSDDVTVAPSTVVLGRDQHVSVTGTGFQDCPGTFELALTIADTWRRSEP